MVAGYHLIHPTTGELVATFQGYTDTGSEVWLTVNGLECCNFEGFGDNGWVRWSQSIDDFKTIVENVC